MAIYKDNTDEEDGIFDEVEVILDVSIQRGLTGEQIIARIGST
jgi:hypothetical protein